MTEFCPTEFCPCGSTKEYALCCKLLHGGQPAQTALELMRARYSAYVLNVPDYIMETTHPASSKYTDNKFAWKRKIRHFSTHSTFKKLDILDFKTKGDVAIVTFVAHLTQDDHDATFTEKSYFEKIGGNWYYHLGYLAKGHDPRLVHATELKTLPLAYYGDPILKKRGEPIVEINDEIKELIEQMIETMDAYDGMGLAAPQVRRSIRLFVIRTPIEGKDDEDDSFQLGDVLVFINPVISLKSEHLWERPESCLSIPLLSGNVKREKEITMEYTTLAGARVIQNFSGWQARIIQHEYDHIEGVLFIDHLPPSEKVECEPFLKGFENRMLEKMKR